MAKKVIFDTNVYRRLAYERSPEQIAQLFRSIRTQEQKNGYEGWGSSVVWLELFVHLADVNDPNLKDCIGGIVGSYLHSRVNESSQMFRLAAKADMLVAGTLFGHIDEKENELLGKFDWLAKMIYENPNKEGVTKYHQYLMQLKRMAENHEDGFMNRFNQLKKEFHETYKFGKDLMKQLYSPEFFMQVATIEFISLARSLEIDIIQMDDEQFISKVQKIIDYFPLPLHLAINILSFIITDENFKIEKGSRRNWYWDYQMLYYASKHAGALLVTNDKAMLQAAEKGEMLETVIGIEDYLERNGMTVNLLLDGVDQRKREISEPA